MSRLRVPAALIVGLALGACGGSAETATVRTAAGTVAFEVEIADSPDERRTGLAGRPELGGNEGMLFVFAGPVRRGFWMKNTLVPLSIAFLAGDGRILRILDMEPCRADSCPVYDPGVTYRTALEVNRGAFARAGIAVGDVVRVER